MRDHLPVGTDRIDVAAFTYDTTRALFDGRVAFDGLDVAMHTAKTIPEMFEKMLVGRAFDVSELGFTYYLRTLENGAPFIALPVFPARAFRHSSVWVSRRSAITEPAQLNGRTVGEFGMYGQDSGIWAKGIMADEHGFAPHTCRWVIGGLDQPQQPFSFIAQPHPPDLQVTQAPAERSLVDLLLDGHIDALFASNVPQLVLDGSTAIRPLFGDSEAVERDYFRRTGIFPVMHTVVLPRELARTRPGLARSLFQGFLAAKEAGADTYRRGRRLYQVTSMLPWTHQLAERDHDVLGDDWWPYGVRANRTAVETFLRYHHEQGITRRQWSPDEVFVPELSDT